MRIGLVAGEASGDLLGAGLIRAVRERLPDATFEGVAGPNMVEAGCDAYETKPIELPRLLETMEKLLETQAKD